MTATQAKVAGSPRAQWKISLRILIVLGAALLVGVGVRHLSAGLVSSEKPAGFVRGVVQGALMPCALPSLIVGNDVAIYAQNNTGLTYKLGYTMGVNSCGAIFFGFVFWRFSRWRKRLNGTAA